jgi:ABC-type nickel/cobalt efflux system permease component RcnA
MIVCFSLGLGLMLGILALTVTKSRRYLEQKWQQFAERISAHITIIAGIAIIIMGAYTLLY